MTKKQFIEKTRKFGRIMLRDLAVACTAGCFIGILAMLVGSDAETIVTNVYGWAIIIFIKLTIATFLFRKDYTAHLAHAPA